MKSKYISGFTLAEIMVVLGVIGVLTCILLPAAFQATPDENVMKFKKAHNTLGTVIRELVNSDQYYKDGMLNIKANGDYVEDSKYFCETFSDVINTKSKNCQDGIPGKASYGYNTTFDVMAWGIANMDYVQIVDENCKLAIEKVGEEIVSSDGVTYFEAGPGTHFGTIHKDYFKDSTEGDADNGDDSRYFEIKDDNGFYRIYKIFCFDVDGLDNGEDPFGYGIRVDGKMINGARADEWLEKGIQGDD